MFQSGRTRAANLHRNDGLSFAPQHLRRERLRQNLVRLQEGLLGDPARVLDASDAMGVVRVVGQIVAGTRAGRKLDVGSLRISDGSDPVEVARALARVTGKAYGGFADALSEIRHLDMPGRFAELVGAPLSAVPAAEALSTPCPEPLLFPDAPEYAARARGLRIQGMAWALAAGWPWGVGVSAAALGSLAAVVAGLFGPLAGGVAVVSGAATLWGGTMAVAHRARALHPAEVAFLERAAQAPVPFDAWAAFFAQFAGNVATASTASAESAASVVEQTVAELAKSRGPYPDRAPVFSTRAGMWPHLDDCAALVSLLSRSALPDATVWRHLSGAVPLAMLQRLNWQPYVYRVDRLAAVAQAQAEGKRVIFVVTHRSHYDTPTILGFLRMFAPAIAAKDDLLTAPWIGLSALRHPWRPTQWRHDGALAIGDCIIVDRDSPQARAHLRAQALQRFDADRSVLIFGPGTRDHTPIPGFEYGLSPFTAGMVNVATATRTRGEDVLFVPIYLVGPGSTMGTDGGRFLKHGIRLNQRMIMGVGEPLAFSDLEAAWDVAQEGIVRTAQRQNGRGGEALAPEQRERLHVRWVTGRIWAATARELLPLQRFAHGWEPPLEE
ncbi:MAG: 1-acyl-sn-glycerol-3-phosphate acyltransferase [Deltaproteobacteria bacterium]|nr:1-acyl-sn-glycerol-3-phosphate acyltransferase [Deltaproteobacteria bacterium]